MSVFSLQTHTPGTPYTLISTWARGYILYLFNRWVYIYAMRAVLTVNSNYFPFKHPSQNNRLLVRCYGSWSSFNDIVLFSILRVTCRILPRLPSIYMHSGSSFQLFSMIYFINILYIINIARSDWSQFSCTRWIPWICLV